MALTSSKMTLNNMKIIPRRNTEKYYLNPKLSDNYKFQTRIIISTFMRDSVFKTSTHKTCRIDVVYHLILHDRKCKNPLGKSNLLMRVKCLYYNEKKGISLCSFKIINICIMFKDLAMMESACIHIP